jgi:hypothetical protein
MGFLAIVLAFLWILHCCLARESDRDCTAVKAIQPGCRSNETPYLRDFFYVGGHYVETSTGNITVNQIYVEKISPVSGPTKKRPPLVFFHGGGVSAVTWLNTPDNRSTFQTAPSFHSVGY